jgi:membrane protein YqaA with SNARE-associated domain
VHLGSLLQFLDEQILDLDRPMIALVTARSVRHWFVQLGGVGLIPLGILDSSVIPLPGSTDIVTIFLCTRDSHLWFYYALMAIVGSVSGGYFTYRLGSKGGKESLARKFSKRKMAKVYKIFERWGFASIAIPAVLPPPMPMVPFLLAAGAMQYSVKKFLAALALGRTARYTILAFLAARYGRQILTWIRQHSSHSALLALAVVIAIGLAVYFFIWMSKPKRHALG